MNKNQVKFIKYEVSSNKCSRLLNLFNTIFIYNFQNRKKDIEVENKIRKELEDQNYVINPEMDVSNFYSDESC